MVVELTTKSELTMNQHSHTQVQQGTGEHEPWKIPKKEEGENLNLMSLNPNLSWLEERKRYLRLDLKEYFLRGPGYSWF